MNMKEINDSSLRNYNLDKDCKQNGYFFHLDISDFLGFLSDKDSVQANVVWLGLLNGWKDNTIGNIESLTPHVYYEKVVIVVYKVYSTRSLKLYQSLPY